MCDDVTEAGCHDATWTDKCVACFRLCLFVWGEFMLEAHPCCTLTHVAEERDRARNREREPMESFCL